MKNPHKDSEYENVMDIMAGAGKLLMGCLGSVKKVDNAKGEICRSSHTTTADVLSLSHIVNRLVDEFPQDGIIAEGLDDPDVVKLLSDELPLKEGRYLGQSGLYWVIDPLCGTIMHEKGIRDFIVSVGLVDESAEIYFGCVHDPCHNETFYATKGRGAYVMNDSTIKQIYVSETDSLKKALVSIEHGLVRSEKKVAELADNIKRQRTAGTCGLELSYVSAGRIDAMLKMGQPLYDYAGGLIILEEAGGIATDFDGNAVTKRPNYDKCTDLVCSNGKMHEQLLGYTKLFSHRKAA